MAVKYWYNAVVGTYPWSNTANWYNGSGGTGGNSGLPGQFDDVILDAASGASNINITTTAQVRSIVATTFTGEISGSAGFQILGSNTVPNTQNSGKTIEWGAGMTYSYTGFYAISASNGSGSINFNGKTHGSGTITFNQTNANPTTAHWSLVNNLTTAGQVSVSSGTLTTNNYNITCIRFNLNNNSFNKVLNLGTSVITCTQTSGAAWANQSAGGLTINGTYTIRFTGIVSGVGNSISFLGNGATYYNVEFIRGSGTGTVIIQGNNTFLTFKDTGLAAHDITFSGGGTQTFGNFDVVGASEFARTRLLSSLTTPPIIAANLTKIGSGAVTCDYLDLGANMTAVTPDFTWYAGYNSIGSGLGWLFRNPPGLLTMGVGG
jgi:hypothetical protein